MSSLSADLSVISMSNISIKEGSATTASISALIDGDISSDL